jgi:hypothetical protein
MGDLWDLIRGGRRILYNDPFNTSVEDGALNRYAQQQGFGGIEHLYLGFAAANAVMDYEEGVDYGDVPIRKVGRLNHNESDAALVPDYLGATYLRATLGSALEASVRGAPSDPWGLSLLVDRADGYRLALGALDPSGMPSLGVASSGAGDVLYAIPSFLDPASSSSSYETSESPFNPPDTTAPAWPAGQTGLSVSAAAGGFDASWDPADDDEGVAGYVVRWGAGSATRSLFGPMTAVEVRALEPDTYEVAVFAYDESGNADPDSAATAQVTISEPPAMTPIPPNPIVATGTTPSNGGSGGGGGGGSGGCFVRSLMQ